MRNLLLLLLTLISFTDREAFALNGPPIYDIDYFNVYTILLSNKKLDPKDTAAFGRCLDQYLPPNRENVVVKVLSNGFHVDQNLIIEANLYVKPVMICMNADVSVREKLSICEQLSTKYGAPWKCEGTPK